MKTFRLVILFALCHSAFGLSAHAQGVVSDLTVQRTIKLTGDVTPSQITANQNDYAPTSLSLAVTLRLSSDASRNVTGLSGGAAGRCLLLQNVGSFNLVLREQDAASTAANRFALGADYTLEPSGGAVLKYDGTSSRWRIVASRSAAVGSGSLTNTGGALTSNALVLGAGSVDTKAVAGLTTDGVSKINVGVAGGTTGGINFANATSGLITLRAVTGALGTRNIFLPAIDDTLVGLDATQTLTNKTFGTATSVTDTTDATTISTGSLIAAGGLGIAKKLFAGDNISGAKSIISTGSTFGLGYATGAGGTVTQATSKATAVTLNKVCGEITLNAASLAADTTVSFVLTNSAIAATDMLLLNHVTTGTFGGYTLNAHGAAAGSVTIDVHNVTAGALAEALVIRFVVFKAVTS